MLADGIATALFVTDARRMKHTDRFVFVRMFADRIESSPGLSGELFA
jgi:hypothetical protein